MIVERNIEKYGRVLGRCVDEFGPDVLQFANELLPRVVSITIKPNTINFAHR